MNFKDMQLWFVTGSQHLYGPEALEHVAEDAREIAQGLSAAAAVPVSVVFKPIVTTADEISRLAQQANADKNCVEIGRASCRERVCVGV